MKQNKNLNNARFLEEAKRLEKKWAELGLLKDIHPDPKKRPAVLLESHRLGGPCWCGENHGKEEDT